MLFPTCLTKQGRGVKCARRRHQIAVAVEEIAQVTPKGAGVLILAYITRHLVRYTLRYAGKYADRPFDLPGYLFVLRSASHCRCGGASLTWCHNPSLKL